MRARNVMDVAGSVALVTGGNRGLGASLCASLLQRCAAAAPCGDVTLLVNNAGIGTGTSALSADAIEMSKQEFDTNVLGPLAVTQAFAPILGANGGGAIVNVLSVLSWFSAPQSALYCAAKAASWSLTNAIRQELHAQGTQVVALHVGF